MSFKKYRRKQIAELRPVNDNDLLKFVKEVSNIVYENEKGILFIPVSSIDIRNGSPKKGDMIARNPNNHLDQWLVAKQDFNDNFEEI